MQKLANLVASERSGMWACRISEGLTGYLVMLARSNSSAYAGLLSKILPAVLAADADSHGGNVEIRFIREIVYPKHVEIEGVTPKALPSPPTLPRPTDPTDDTNEGAAR